MKCGVSMRKQLENILPFWKVLSEKEKQYVIRTMEVYDFKRNDEVYPVKEEAAGLKIIITGRIRIFLSTSEGNEITLYRLGEQAVSIWSILSMLEDRSIEINAKAEKESVICIIPKKVCDELSDKYKEVREFIQYIITKQISEIIKVVRNLAFVKVSKRLASCLIMHSQWNHNATFFITHEELANDIGSAREVVSRTLKQFQTIGFVSLGRGKITIIDMEGLRKI